MDEIPERMEGTPREVSIPTQLAFDLQETLDDLIATAFDTGNYDDAASYMRLKTALELALGQD